MNLKGELPKCAKKGKDTAAISGNVMKTFPDIKGWLDIKKLEEEVERKKRESDRSWGTFHGFLFFLRESPNRFYISWFNSKTGKTP